MPLTRNRDHLYFTLKGSKKLYLGTTDTPIRDRLETALKYLNERITKYEAEKAELVRLLSGGIDDVPLKYKLVVFDLDGVIFEKPWFSPVSEKVAVSTWDLLFKALGFYDVHEKYRKQFEDRVFPTYMEWTNEACRFLKNVRLDRQTFEKVLREREFTQGAVETLRTLTSRGVVTAIVTGSFDQLAQRVCEQVNVDAVMAHCELVFNKGGFLDSWKLRAVDYKDKVRFVRDLAEKHGIESAQCAYVGDDVNDRDAFKEVGLSIAFNAEKAIVRQSAKVVIDSNNLASILPHLYDRDKAIPSTRQVGRTLLSMSASGQ
jgi:HAD superfamily phosphoserine phosphatase-like hydrolase